MKIKRGIGCAFALAVSCAVITPAWAESPDAEETPKRRQMRMKDGHHGPMHADMRARMHAHDLRLDELVAAMNAAEGEAKIDAVAAVVNELVAQRRTRREHLEERWKKQNSTLGEGEKGEAD